MSKSCIIYETLNDVKTLKVQKDNNLMKLSGCFGQCGVRNNNARIYETKNYAKMVENMQARIAKAPIPGELEHPSTMNITLENVSHRIDSIQIDENGLVTGEITLLDTPKGRIARAIVEGGLPLFISSRATGNVDPKTGVVTLETLATYDLVGSPGFSQAELHLNENQVAESICENLCIITEKEEPQSTTENQNNDTNNMEMTELLEKFNALEEKVNALEESNKVLAEENASLKEAVNSAPKFDLEKIANGIQTWIVEEYTPKVQNWITDIFAESIREDIVDEAVTCAHDNFIAETAPKIQNWVINEFAPEVEKWCCTELAEGIQSWTIKEFAPTVQDWMDNQYTEKLTEAIAEMTKTQVDEAIAEAKVASKKDKLTAIDETLSLLESIDIKKPTYTRKVNENANEPLFISNMPDTAHVQWEMASNEVKESISRRAKLYDFTVEGAIEKFWAGIDFSAVKPVNHIYEGLDNIADERERNIRAQFRSWRNARG